MIACPCLNYLPTDKHWVLSTSGVADSVDRSGQDLVPAFMEFAGETDQDAGIEV